MENKAHLFKFFNRCINYKHMLREKTATFLKRIIYNNGSLLILATKKFAILNGINQPCTF